MMNLIVASSTKQFAPQGWWTAPQRLARRGAARNGLITALIIAAVPVAAPVAAPVAGGFATLGAWPTRAAAQGQDGRVAPVALPVLAQAPLAPLAPAGGQPSAGTPPGVAPPGIAPGAAPMHPHWMPPHPHMHGYPGHPGQAWGHPHHAPWGRSEMGRGDRMHRFDTDRDGQVTRAELEAAQKKQLELFERADADHDGRLTREEMRALRAQRWAERRGAPRGERPALARPPVEPSKD